ncbi:hypothetical protein [Rhodosalinus sp. FB01]|uniref:hypothetical protein n=1 Tax=Rhodosalinus sp. FB01 TaxID=3239194 RepID=UPI0035263A07
MNSQAEIPGAGDPSPLRQWGAWAVLAGVAGLVLVFVQIVGPTLEPTPSVGAQIGEIAGEIRRSAWRSFFGLSAPEPEPSAVTAWAALAIAAPLLGIAALVLAAISAIARENRRYAAYGASLGAAAITFQFIWLVALLIACVVLLVAIIENMGDIFGI